MGNVFGVTMREELFEVVMNIQSVHQHWSLVTRWWTVHHAIFGNKGLGDQLFYDENISINDMITKKLQWGEVSAARIHHKLLERYEQQSLNLWSSWNLFMLPVIGAKAMLF